MPIYEYHCESCGGEFETLVLRRDEPVRCKLCGAAEVTRLISAHAVGGGTQAEASPCAGGACPPVPACGAGACPACE
ncbi:MAG: zinc ribbon domain-containing protein [Mariprofundaceae bacterium]